MRIGEVNKDNYKDYLKLFNVKNAKEIEESIDRVWGKDKESEFDHSLEAAEKYLVSIGYAEEGMLIDINNDGSWKKIVPVSDDIKNKLIETIRRQFLTNGDGMTAEGDGDELGAILKDYRKNIDPSERLSVTWTLNQIITQESQRLIGYVKSNMSGWKHGEPIDPDVLKAAVSGNHFDVKA